MNLIDSSSPTKPILAVIDVESDAAEERSEGIQRRITGVIRSRYPSLDEFMKVGTGQPVKFIEENGRTYCRVKGLVVDHDCYIGYSAIHISPDGRTIDILLFEDVFEGSLEEFRQWVIERNQKVQLYLDKLEKGVVSRNDVRQWEGLDRMSMSAMDQPLPLEEVQKLRSLAQTQVVKKWYRIG